MILRVIDQMFPMATMLLKFIKLVTEAMMLIQLIYQWENLYNLQKNKWSKSKKQNDGSPILKEIVTVKDRMPFFKELDIRENDVFFLNIIKL